MMKYLYKRFKRGRKSKNAALKKVLAIALVFYVTFMSLVVFAYKPLSKPQANINQGEVALSVPGVPPAATEPTDRQTTSTQSNSKDTPSQTSTSEQGSSTDLTLNCDTQKEQTFLDKYSAAYNFEKSRHEQEIVRIQNKYSASGTFNSSYRSLEESAENLKYETNVSNLKSTLKFQMFTVHCTYVEP